jgi:hypothetical protein
MWGAGGVAAAVLAAVVGQNVVRPALLRRVVRRSLAVQRAVLAAHRVDVVVGSSFGGAMALQLLGDGSFSGPTVLLCPAQELVAARAKRAACALPSDAQGVIVVHGRQDQTVPIEHSRALVRGTAATLLEVDDDHRLSVNATPTNLGAWVRQAMAAGQSSRPA